MLRSGDDHEKASRHAVRRLFAHPDDLPAPPLAAKIDVPWAWYVAGAVLHMVFLAAAPQVLWSAHFESWYRLTQSASESFPRFIESLESPSTVVVLIASLLLGVTATRRVARGEFRTILARGVLIAATPIIIETVAFGVQDGSPRDLNLVAPHSLALLVLILVGPLVAIGLDVHRLSRPFTG